MSVQQDAYPLPKATGEVRTASDAVLHRRSCRLTAWQKIAETERLDGQHEMFKLALGGITVAPLPTNISSVLDLGCGTGIWSCQFAESHPSANVLGVDVNAPNAPPDGRLVPSNCAFVQANVEDDWQFADPNSCDFIFARLLVAGLKNWPQLFSRVYQHLRPDGLFELYEGVITFCADDESAAKGSAMMRWFDQFREFVGARGVKIDAPLAFTELLQDAGFTVIHDRIIRMYLDPHVAAAKTSNGAQIATELTRDLQRLITNTTDKVFTSEAQRILAVEALEDLAQNSGSRGYYLLHTHKVAQRPA